MAESPDDGHYDALLGGVNETGAWFDDFDGDTADRWALFEGSTVFAKVAAEDRKAYERLVDAA